MLSTVSLCTLPKHRHSVSGVSGVSGVPGVPGHPIGSVAMRSCSFFKEYGFYDCKRLIVGMDLRHL